MRLYRQLQVVQLLLKIARPPLPAIRPHVSHAKHCLQVTLLFHLSSIVILEEQSFPGRVMMQPDCDPVLAGVGSSAAEGSRRSSGLHPRQPPTVEVPESKSPSVHGGSETEEVEEITINQSTGGNAGASREIVHLHLLQLCTLL